MNSYIFISQEGYTFQPDSESIEPDIENCQVVGFAKGVDENDAFKNLMKENDYLLETTFDELICFELKHPNGMEHKTYHYLSENQNQLKICQD
ncbi:MAG: hypothetical protein ACYSSP_02905 [Planctomycetota bacterium]|jgi:hypothetical protein